MVLEHQALDQRKTFLLQNMPSITREKETVKIARYNCKARGGRGGGEPRAKRNKSALCQTSTCILDQHKNTTVLQFFKTSAYLNHVLVVKWFKKRSDFRMTLKNGFGKCSLFVLSANGRKDQNMDSSFSRQRKP